KVMNLKSSRLISQKKAAGPRLDPRRETTQSGAVACARPGRTCHRWHQAGAVRERYPAQYATRMFGYVRRDRHRLAQSARASSQAGLATMSGKSYFVSV